MRPVQTMNGIKFTIVSACRNEASHIAALLASIEQQKLEGVGWEAILADGMSTDGTREYLDKFTKDNPRFRVIANPQRIVSTGLNAAIQAAHGEIIIRMDAHTAYDENYCAKCIETLLATCADNVGGPARTRVKGVLARAVAAAYHSRFSTGGAHFHDVNYEGYVDTVTYGCWRKETLERLGMFDEALVRNQDDELNLRIIRNGGKVWQNPAIISWYSPRPNIPALFRQYFQYGFWKVHVIRKHRRPGSWRHLVPAAFIVLNVALLVAGIAGLLLGAAWLMLLWMALFGTYAAANLLASLVAAKNEGWDTLPYLPLVFGAYHISYGSGFLLAMLQSGGTAASAAGPRSETVFTRISR